MKVMTRSMRSHRIQENVPGPEAIQEMTAEIRKTWTPRERRRRASLARYVELIQMPLIPRRRGFWTE